MPYSFDKGHMGSFYMPNRTDPAGHSKAFDYPVMDHWGVGGGESKCSGTRQIRSDDQSVIRVLCSCAIYFHIVHYQVQYSYVV